MPEGHTIHRAARGQSRMLAGKIVNGFNDRSQSRDLAVRPRISVGSEGEILVGMRMQLP